MCKDHEVGIFETGVMGPQRKEGRRGRKLEGVELGGYM